MSKKNSNPHSGHRSRMRDRFEKENYSFNAFHPHEILEMILFRTNARKNTNEIAHELLLKFDTIQGVLSAPLEELCSVDGVGKVSAEYLIFLGALFNDLYDD